MKILLAVLTIALGLAIVSAVQAKPFNGDQPGWAQKAFSSDHD